MKVQIKQFKNLKGLSFEIPCEISGSNGQGKSNALNAILWTLSEKNTENETAIPFDSDYAEVSVIFGTETFTRKTEWKKVRKAGETEAKITGTTSTYSINLEAVNKSTYMEAIKATIGAIQYAEPFYFTSLKNAEKIEIINQIVGIEKPNVNFSELNRAVKTAKDQVDNQLFLIENLNGKISDTSDLEALISAKTAEITQLQSKIVNKDTTIETHNAEILSKIQTIEIEKFKPTELKSLRSKADAERQLLELQIIACEAPSLIVKEKPTLHEAPKEPIKPVETSVFQIADNCTACPLFKKDLEEQKGEFSEKLADYERKMNAWVLDCENVEKNNQQLIQNWKDANKQAEEIFESEVIRYEKIKEHNAKIPARRAELEALILEIDEANKTIEDENAKIVSDNETSASEFEQKKQAKIFALRKQLKAQTSTETNTEILNQIKEVEASRCVLTDELAVIRSKKTELSEAKNDLSSYQSTLISAEKKVIEAKNLIKNWRDAFDSKCLLLFEGKIKIATTRETYSDTLEDCFELYFNRGGEWTEFGALNHSDSILCAVEVSKVLCKHFNCKMPLLVDNAEAINESRRPKNCVLGIVSTCDLKIK